jgi:hypothetical protein
MPSVSGSAASSINYTVSKKLQVSVVMVHALIRSGIQKKQIRFSFYQQTGKITVFCCFLGISIDARNFIQLLYT